MKVHRHRFLPAIVVGVLAVTQASAENQTNELLKYLPDSVNALVVVDLAGLKRSPLGVKEKWAKQQEERYVAGISSFPPHANRFVMGALIDLSALQNTWAIGVARMARGVPIAAVARAEAAPPDQISGYPIALSSRNAYFVGLASDLVGVFSPGNRQQLGRWLRFAAGNSNVAISRYLASAAQPAQPAQVLLAIDLSEGIDAGRIRRALIASKVLASHAGVDPAEVAKVIARIQGLRLYVRVDDQIEGQLITDFTASMKSIRELSKPLLLEALSNTGLYLPELEDWRPQYSEKSMALTGPLTEKSLRRLATLIQTPVPATGTPAEIAGHLVQGQIENQQINPIVVASKNYFSAVNTIVADLRGQEGGTKQLATWFSRCSQQIDQLPLLNVDPDLLKYGADISQSLRSIGLMLQGVTIENKYLQKNREAAYSGLRQVVGYAPGPWDPYGGWGIDYSPAITAGANNILAMKATQDTMIIRSKFARDQLWAQIDTATSQMRRTLVAKYQTDF